MGGGAVHSHEAEVDRRGDGETRAAQVDKQKQRGFFLVFLVFTARYEQKNEHCDKRHKPDTHHGAVKHPKTRGKPDLEEGQSQRKPLCNRLYPFPCQCE